MSGPSIADEISVTLARQANVGSAGNVPQDVAAGMSVSLLVSRIREVFELPHA